MNLLKHGDTKFPQARLLGTSKDLGWRGIATELRSHPGGDLPSFESSQIEITIAPQGVRDAYVSRKGWGVRQKTMVEPEAIWISPVGVTEDDIRISRDLPAIFHIYLPVERFAGLAAIQGFGRASPYEVRYLAGIRDDLIMQIGHTLAEEMRNPSAAGRLLADSLALALTARLAQRYSDQGSRAPASGRTDVDELRIRRAIDFMQAHLEEDIGLGDVAAAVAVSPFHFARLFRATTGTPPHRYLANLRIERSKALLAQGIVPLSDIAFSAQFANQANFTRAFRKATGMTPAEYRRSAS